nr:CHASE2 domain-containing protein [Burkholderiales bacterium]
LVSWSGCGTSYPLLLGASRRGATPAMALFDATCRRRPQLPACQFDGKAPLEVAERFVAPMTVRWGAFAPGEQAPFYAAGVCQRMTDAEGRVPALSRLLRSLQQLALGALFDLRDRRDPDLALPCPAVPVLRADAILDGDAAAVDALLRGRAVLLGAQVSGIPDWQVSPVHGRVPGVVLHAMALDNLLAHGDGYLRPLSSTVSRTVMLLLACAAAVFAPWVVARRPLLTDATRAVAGLVLWAAYAVVLASHGHWSQAAAVLGVAIAFDLIKPTDTFRYALLFLVMAVLANLALAVGRTPWNWIGLVFVVLASTETLKAYLKGGPPKHFPHAASMCRRAWAARRTRSAPPLSTGSPS